MSRTVSTLLSLASVALGASAAARPIARSELCVTLGAVTTTSAPLETHLLTESPKLRAVVGGTTAATATLHFRYLGPTTVTAPLASGAVRTQIGLKLRAQDGCNLIYVMWRLTPEARLVVSVKQNAGRRTHAECGTQGYRTVKSTRAAEPPAVALGEDHALTASLEGTELRVLADERVVWQGDLGPEILVFDGPAGLRTDNGRFELALDAAPGIGRVTGCVPSHAGDD